MIKEKQTFGVESITELPCWQGAKQCWCEIPCKDCIESNLLAAGWRKREWISVDERLPGVSGRYICAVKDKNGHTWTVAGDYNLEMKSWFGLLFGEIKNTVTHWMPFPEPPKGE